MTRVPALLVAALAHGLAARAVRLQARGVPTGSGAEGEADIAPPQGLDLGSFRAAIRAEQQPSYGHPSWLHSCTHIYLDVGSNIGVQVRKLFEPAKYPNATRLLAEFTKVFGEPAGRPEKVCALGIEPNPHHQPRLQALGEAYSARGFRTHFYPYAAWAEEGNMTFVVTGLKTANEQWASHLFKSREVVQVRTIDLNSFIESLPKGSVKLMKLDIEGAEYETLGHGIPQGMMCNDHVENVYFEAHAWGQTSDFWKGPRGGLEIMARIKGHTCKHGSPTDTLSLDDESYVHDVDSDFMR